MKLFLTSHIGGHFHQGKDIYPEMLLEENGFLLHLKSMWKSSFRCLMIANNPEALEENDLHSKVFKESFRMSGLFFEVWDILDNRNRNIRWTELQKYDFLLLLGGHVPTQHDFFESIKLRELLVDYHGIIAGISAGTMNCASIVYSIPELTGEAKDPSYQRFFPGLNLTKIQVIPHYQWLKQITVDEKRMIEDLAIPDSLGNTFVLLPDGSYIFQEEKEIEICGEAYLLKNGKIHQIGWQNEHHSFQIEEGGCV